LLIASPRLVSGKNAYNLLKIILKIYTKTIPWINPNTIPPILLRLLRTGVLNKKEKILKTAFKNIVERQNIKIIDVNPMISFTRPSVNNLKRKSGFSSILE